MPRRTLPPRLVLRREATGSTWVIRYGQRYIRTGCPENRHADAVRFLARWVEEQAVAAPGRAGRARDTEIAEVLRAYLMERGPSLKQQATLRDTMNWLIPFWGRRMVAEINGSTCREYARFLKNPSSARRSLETLRAALRHYHREYGLDILPVLTLPETPRPRTAWLTRKEAAALLRAARGGSTGSPHLTRFILVALYTGTRSSAVLALRWMPNTGGGWIDVDKGLLYRSAAGARVTRKRQPTARVPDRLLAHCRRWRELDAADVPVVHWHGRQVRSIKKAFRAARHKAGLPAGVVPHTLRHTAITWAMQAGKDRWQAAGFFGLTMETLEETYGHHHPDFQSDMARIF